MEKLIGKEKVCALFKKFYGVEPSSFSFLPGAGGDRIYFRLHANRSDAGLLNEASVLIPESVIGVYGTDVKENHSFVSLAECMKRYNIPVPEVYAVSDDMHCYLQQDLGHTSLYSLLSDANIEHWVRLSLERLAKMQNVPYENWKDSVYNEPFSKRQVFWDLNYFKYEYLKNTPVVFSEQLLEDDFDALASDLCNLNEEGNGFMYRDFQSRNVMINDSLPYFIDFQGGRLGPCLYDAVSFLWQAKAGWSKEFKDRMINHYADCFCKEKDITKEEFLSGLNLIVLFRTLQVLGAYGFRGLVQKRAHFVESIPGALGNLGEILKTGVLDAYPELSRVCNQLIDDERFRVGKYESGEEPKPLTCEIFSFSYKRGYPDDFSGNGGGFMFDCRGMHNPGRYEQFKQLTGRDDAVIDFLEDRGEVQQFVSCSFDMVRKSVDTYIRRGFSKLQIGFGCTGGQHRSVYCADRFAKELRNNYPDIRIVVKHREQGIEEVI